MKIWMRSDVQYYAGVAELQSWSYELCLSVDFAYFTANDFFRTQIFSTDRIQDTHLLRAAQLGLS